MNIQTIFSHLFIKRGFLGLLALLWGFMLGGCLLITVVTYGAALAGVSRFGVSLCQMAVLAMVLPLAWMTMEGEYQEKIVTSASGFLRAFLVAVFYGMMMPILLIIEAVITGRERFEKKDTPMTTALNPDRLTSRRNRNPVRSVRGKPVNFWQDMMRGFFLKLAR